MAFITLQEMAKKTGYTPPAPVKTPEPVVKVVQAPVKPQVSVVSKPTTNVSTPMPAVKPVKENTDSQRQQVPKETFTPTTNPTKLAVSFQDMAKKNGLQVTGVDMSKPPVPTKQVPVPSDTPESTAPSLFKMQTVQLSPQEIQMQNDLEKDGIIKSLIKAPIKDLIVTPGVRLAQVLTEIARPDVRAGERDITTTIPGLGAFDVPAQKTGVQGVKQIAGQGLSAASWLYAPEKVMNAGRQIFTDAAITAVKTGQPIATAAVRNAYWNVIKNGAKEGAILGGLDGLGRSLQEDKKWDDNAKDFIIGALFGGAAGAVLTGTGAAFSIAKNKTQFIQNELEKELIAGGMSPQQARQFASQAGFVKIADDAVKVVDNLQQKERGVMKTVRTGKVTSPELKSVIKAPENEANRFYDVATDKDALAFASSKIAEGVDSAHSFVKSGQYNKNVVATGLELIKKYDAEGSREYAYDIVEHLSKLATETGQANQAWSLYNNLSPEGIIGFAKKQLGKAGIELTPDLTDSLRKQAQKVAELPDGTFEKKLETAVMLKMISDKVPSTFLQKVSAVQTMAQLLNPKTIIRNIGGNSAFAGMEHASQHISNVLDKLTSVVTGKRTQGAPSLRTQAKGFKKGLLEAFEETKRGVDIDAEGKFGGSKKAFKGKIGGAFQKALDVALKVPDKAFYQGAFDDSLRVQMKIAGVSKPTEEMIERAIYDGQYRTFNDESLIAKGLQKIKKGLNSLTGSEDFGLGDAILKYPKVPGNILSRGIAYSPAGFMQTVFELAKPLFGKEFNQRAFVDSTSRALTGTALIGTGAILHKLGIITGKSDEDKDIRALENETGLGQYKVNTSALKRYVMSGFDAAAAKKEEGDTLASYDWLQPTSIGLSIGANIDQNAGKFSKRTASQTASDIAVSVAEGANTLAEQPLLQGLTRPLKYADSLVDAGLVTLKGVPASFIPTVLNQVRQISDPNMRDVRDSNWLKETFVTTPSNKIPGLSKNLPAKIDTLGNEQKYKGPIETFLSPATITKIKTNPTSRLVMDIYEKTGDAKAAPRIVPLTQSIVKFDGVDENGDFKTHSESIKITAKQANDMQKWIGQTTDKIFSGLSANEQFRNAPIEEQSKYLTGILSDINTVAKIKYIGHKPSKASVDAQAIYQMFP